MVRRSAHAPIAASCSWLIPHVRSNNCWHNTPSSRSSSSSNPCRISRMPRRRYLTDVPNEHALNQLWFTLTQSVTLCTWCGQQDGANKSASGGCSTTSGFANCASGKSVSVIWALTPPPSTPFTATPFTPPPPTPKQYLKSGSNRPLPSLCRRNFALFGGTRNHFLWPHTLTLHENERATSTCAGVHVPWTPQYTNLNDPGVFRRGEAEGFFPSLSLSLSEPLSCSFFSNPVSPTRLSNPPPAIQSSVDSSPPALSQSSLTCPGVVYAPYSGKSWTKFQSLT
mmetsp:Transcript_10803/g.40047  ORF Transcript_10803/g.40047 Transcript_10803/m.40047 type:complete len:282 (+) Transcript_10803:1311-2156(+)